MLKSRPDMRKKLSSFLGLLLLLAACGGNEESVIPQTFVNLEYVSILGAEDMNDRWPVALDLVRSAESLVAVELSGLSARDWFLRKQEFRNNYPDLVVDSWEVVPGQSIIDSYVDEGYELAGYFFINYRNDNANRLRLTLGGTVLLKLERDDFSIEQQAPESSSWWWPF